MSTMEKALDLEKAIDDQIGQVRTGEIDMSFGEIISLHSNGELIIQPEYQRLFRWSPEQQSRLIESILLELPIPPIFVIENEDGAFELIDGLQRVRSVFHFIEFKMLDDDPLMLQGCELIRELNDLTYDDLPLRLRLRIKRSAVRMNIIKRQSSSKLRYEMFKRLNTGGSLLSHQEIRNCTARMVGQPGIGFYEFLKECAQLVAYKQCISSLAVSEIMQGGDEELVLRFFALKNGRHLFRQSVRDWLDDYMEQVIFGEVQFDYETERTDFNNLFSYLNTILGEGAFVRYNNEGNPVGGLSSAYFEAVSMGVLSVLPGILQCDPEQVRQTIIKTIQSESFREFTGASANTRPKLKGRIDAITNALNSIGS